MRDFVSQLQGGLIVSCQAYPGEPMRHPETMAQIALSAQLGGAAGIRCQGLADISAVKGQGVGTGHRPMEGRRERSVHYAHLAPCTLLHDGRCRYCRP